MSKNFDLLAIACLVGFFGDMILQVGVYNNLGGPTGWGLKDYFKLHGPVESLFIPAGMLTLFYIIYIYLNIPLNVGYLALYGVILDFIFRKFMLCESLKEYYEYFNYFWSAVWGASPLVLPYLIYKRVF
jgi:hypothetical protein